MLIFKTLQLIFVNLLLILVYYNLTFTFNYQTLDSKKQNNTLFIEKLTFVQKNYNILQIINMLFTTSL